MPQTYTYPGEPLKSLPKHSVFSHLFAHGTPDDRKALVDVRTGKYFSYGGLVNTSKRLAYGLRHDVGLKRGDTIMLFAPNSIYWPVASFGCQAAGLRTALANSAYQADELKHAWDISDAKAIICPPNLIKVVKEAGISTSVAYVIIDQDASAPAGFRSIWDLCSSRELEPERFDGDAAHETAYIPFSSGTTGKGKGVELSHYNVTSMIEQLRCIPNGTTFPGVRTLVVLPFFHAFGNVCALMCTIASAGTTYVLAPFDLPLFCEAIEKHKIQSTFVVPPMALGLAVHPIVPKYDYSSLNQLLCAAAPLGAEVAEKTAKRLGMPVVQGWGMTETTVAGTVATWKHNRPGSVGRPVPGVEIRFVDPDGKDVPRGERGELWVRGPNIMKGYTKNLSATAEALDEQGWLHTGDVGYIDKDDFIFIVDRVKELIKYKGFQVPPAELEALLLTHPKVADAAVVGVYAEEQATELPRAYVVVKPGVTRDASTVEEIVAFVRAKVAAHKRLRGGVRFLDAVPRTAAGKILRKDLRKVAQKEQNESKNAVPKAKL